MSEPPLWTEHRQMADRERAELLRLRRLEKDLRAMGLSEQILRGSREGVLRAVVGDDIAGSIGYLRKLQSSPT